MTDAAGTETPGTETPGIPGTDTAGTDSVGTPTPGTGTPGTETPGTGSRADTDPTETLAPLGGPAEPEPAQHTADPDRSPGATVEDSIAYELAVEDGAPLAAQDAAGSTGGSDRGADGTDPGAGDLAPEFREPESREPELRDPESREPELRDPESREPGAP